MAPTHGRHRARSRRATLIRAALAGVCVLALIGVGLWIARPWQDEPATTAQPSSSTASGAASGGTSTGSSSGAVRPGTGSSSSAAASTVAVWTGTPNDPIIAKLAGRLGTASPYRLVAAKSAADADLLLTTGSRAGPDQVASTPVVLAMPPQMAKVAGTPTTDNLQAWMNGKKTWANQGRPGWGNFSLTVADPKTNPLGAVAYGALTTMVNGGPVTGRANPLEPSQADLAVAHAGQALQPAPTPAAADAVLEASDVDAFADRTSGVLTTEQAVLAHNARPGALQFAAIPLLGGRAAVPVEAKVAAGARNKAGAEAVLRQLQAPAGLAALQSAGFRGVRGEHPSPSTAPKIAAPQYFSTNQLTSARSGFASTQRKSSTVGLLDLSGSMALPLGDSGVTRAQLLKRVVRATSSLAPPNARSTVWFFASRNGKDRVYDDLALAENDSIRGGVKHSDAVQSATARARAIGGTPLYLAIQRAYDYATAHYTPGMPNQVLVLSDGADADNFNDVSLSDVTSYLTQRFDKTRPVRVHLVLAGPGRNLAQLRQIAAATGGTTVPVRSMADVPKVFGSAIFN